MRDLDLNVLDAIDLDRETIAMAVLGEFEFASGTQNLWAGPEGHQIAWDSKVWTALGEIGPIDKITEGQDLADSRTRVSLRVNSENIDVIEVEDSRGRAATLILLIMSDEGTPIGPVSFRTTMGAPEIRAEVEVDEHGRKRINELLSLELLNETATLGNRHFTRHTYETGLRIDATDHGLEFVSDPEAGNLGLHHGRPDGPRGPGGPRRGNRR